MGIQTKKNNRILKQKQSKLRRHNFIGGGDNNNAGGTHNSMLREAGDLIQSSLETVAGEPAKAVGELASKAKKATIDKVTGATGEAVNKVSTVIQDKAEEVDEKLDNLEESAARKLGKAADFAEKISPVKFAKNEIKDAADYLGEKAGEVSEKVGKKTSKALNKIESVTSGIGVDRGTIGSLFTSDENCRFDVPSKATGQIENKSESDLKNKLNKNTLFKDDKKFKKFMEDRIINKCREYHDVSKKQPNEYFMRFFNHCSNLFDCFDDLSELVYLFYDVTKTDISFLSQVKEEKNEKNKKQEIDTKVEIKKKELDEFTKEQDEKLEQEKQIGESEEDTKKRKESEKKKKSAMDKIIKEKQKKLDGIENSKKDLLKTIVILLKSVEKLANSDKISSFDELKKEDLGLDETKFKEHIENLKSKIEKQTTRLQSGGDTGDTGKDEVNEEGNDDGNENENKKTSKQTPKENSNTNSNSSRTPVNSKPNSKKSSKIGQVSDDSKQILLTIANDELSLTEKSLSKVIESYKDNQPKKLEKKLEDEIENKLLKNIKSKVENTLNNVINEYEKAIGNQVNKNYAKLLNFLKYKMEQSKLDKFLIKYSFSHAEEGYIKNDEENDKLKIFIESVEDYLKKDKSETIAKTKEKIEGLLLTENTIDELKGKKVTSDPTDVKETGKDLNKLRKELKEAKKELDKLLPKDGDTVGQGPSDETENKELEAAKKRVKDLEKQIKEAEKDFSSKSESFDAKGFKQKLEILVFFMNNVFIASVKEYGAINSSSEFKFKDDLSRELSKIIEFNKYKEQIDKLDRDKGFRANLFKIGDTNFIDNKMFETVKIEKRSGEEIPAFDMSELYKKLNNKDVRKNIYDYYTALMQLEIDMESGKVKVDSKFEQDKFGPNMYMYIVLGFLGTALGFELANLQNVRAAMEN